ncbi:MAG TPA: porin [Pseudidiomarina sp.]|nr:porin [Pseudidiomarina sp.]
MINSHKNTLFVAGALLFTASPMAVQAADVEPTFDFYGRINVSLQQSDDGTDSDSEVVSNASRIGVRGGAQLSESLEVIYQLEWQVDVADLGRDDNLRSRNQFIGLRGNFGEVTVGRRDTVLKTIQGDIDGFNDYEADIKVLFEGENRTKNTVSYYSPKWNQFAVAASYVVSEDNAVDDGISMAVTYGDEDLDDTRYYLAAGMDSKVEGYDIIRAVGYTHVGETMVGLMWQDQEQVDGTAQADGYLVSAQRPFGKFVAKIQYQMMDFENGRDNSLAFGADYRFTRNTKVFAWYTGRDLETINADQSYVAVGIEHRF